MLRKLTALGILTASTLLPATATSAGTSVEMTWMSIANWYFQVGDERIMMDGYITRVPGPPFFYSPPNFPGDLYAFTKEGYPVDTPSVTKVKEAMFPDGRLDYMLVGHSHFDHSWDSPLWSKITGAQMIGGNSTCLQAQAQGVANAKCRSVSGGEKIELGNGVTIRVVRFNHSGDLSNPIQHFARELYRPPVAEAKGFRGGVGEDYPNGGGNRAFLFTIAGADGPLTFFVNNSASAFDLDKDVVVDGVSYGSPLGNLAAAMKDAGLTQVDAWIGTGGEPVAKLIVPVIHPKVYIPSHWDGLFNGFWPGMPYPFKDDGLAAYLKALDIPLMAQHQYFDKYVLTKAGVSMADNHALKAKLGFSDAQTFKQSMLDAVQRVATTRSGEDCGEGFQKGAWETLFAQIER